MDENVTLISRAQSGDEQAFAELMRAYYVFVYRIVIEIVNNPHDAEEVVQDTFLNVYRGLARYDERMKFRGWLAKIARNRALNWQRTKRLDTVPFNDVSERTLQVEGSPSDQLIRDEELEMVRRAMNTLAQKDRDIARSYYLEGASYDELIRAHGLSYKAISFRLSRAKRTLAKRLQYLLNAAFIPPAITVKKISSGGVTAMKIGTVPKITVGVIPIIALGFFGSRQLLSPKEDFSLSSTVTVP
ncbi:MAG: sigma-70 family RNA polymerase sigma factor [Candidatus Poribacteria bacterium]|nr:sigma-70 family RNA polymerase sigma factor [Candidatus Poribacteria bacterium]